MEHNQHDGCMQIRILKNSTLLQQADAARSPIVLLKAPVAYNSASHRQTCSAFNCNH